MCCGHFCCYVFSSCLVIMCLFLLLAYFVSLTNSCFVLAMAVVCWLSLFLVYVCCIVSLCDIIRYCLFQFVLDIRVILSYLSCYVVCFRYAFTVSYFAGRFVWFVFMRSYNCYAVCVFSWWIRLHVVIVFTVFRFICIMMCLVFSFLFWIHYSMCCFVCVFVQFLSLFCFGIGALSLLYPSFSLTCLSLITMITPTYTWYAWKRGAAKRS